MRYEQTCKVDTGRGSYDPDAPEDDSPESFVNDPLLVVDREQTSEQVSD